jgi:hypothetical protein
MKGRLLASSKSNRLIKKRWCNDKVIFLETHELIGRVFEPLLSHIFVALDTCAGGVES